jgi:hypothetical protein
MDKIKCGRVSFELTDGDTVMDNGSCLQLITRRIHKGFTSYSPRVSKKEFAKFKTNKNVSINTSHDYPSYVTLWTYLNA